jgi:hypothetical protein
MLILYVILVCRSRDISAVIVMGYGLDCQGSILGRKRVFFYNPQRSDRLYDPPILLSNDYRGLLFFWGIKRLGRKDDYSPPSSVEVKNCEFISPLRSLSSWRGKKVKLLL